MSTQLTLRHGYTREQVDLIKDTVCKGASDDELDLFLYTCKRTGLDPFMKQIYSIQRGKTRTTQTAIDGFRAIAERTGKYAPGDEPKFTYDKEGNLISATAYVKKLTADGTWHVVPATIYWKEFVNTASNFHRVMPHVMAAKTAEAHALRKAFPLEFSGIYASEEMVNGMSKDLVEETQQLIEVQPLEEDTVKLEIPEGIDAEQVENYFNLLAEEYKKSIPILKKSAIKNIEKFWSAFNKWQESLQPKEGDPFEYATT